MSLLIDALKKHRQESPSLLVQESEKVGATSKPRRIKKILILSFSIVIVIVITAIASFLIFKHLEKKRIAEVMQGKGAKILQIKKALAEKTGGAEPGLPEGGALRAKLQQRMEQNNNQSTTTTDNADAASTSSTTESSADTATSTSATTSETPPKAARGADLRNRLSAKRAGADAASSDQAASDAAGTDSTDATDSATDTTSRDTSSDDTSDSSDSQDDSSDAPDKKVDIQVVADQTGANNPTYQKALSFMQANQFDKAISLLENNDELMFKTKGLSTLLLTRIYLTMGKYDLAEEVVENGLMLHAGSEMELIALKAQSLFMQQRYQETIELLSSQSPDLSTFPEYYSLLADAYMHVDQPGNAISIFQQIVARFPSSADYWLGLAVAYQKMGETNGAAVAYRRAAQLSQDDPQVSLFINQQLNVLQTT